jgi:hypothetical protein
MLLQVLKVVMSQQDQFKPLQNSGFHSCADTEVTVEHSTMSGTGNHMDRCVRECDVTSAIKS